MLDGKSEAVERVNTARLRVRTPGKHIVLFSLAVTFMLALSTTMLRSGLPQIEKQPASPDDLYAPAEEYLIDLSPDAAGREAYLKLSARIVARDAAALKEIVENRPEIRERISFFLRELSPEDLEGSDAMVRLKAELKKRANLPLDRGAVRDVVIEEIVIQ